MSGRLRQASSWKMQDSSDSWLWLTSYLYWKFCQNFFINALQSKAFSSFPLFFFFFFAGIWSVSRFHMVPSLLFLPPCLSHRCVPQYMSYICRLILAPVSCGAWNNTVGSFTSFPVCGWENGGPEWLSNLPRLTQLGRARAGNQIQIVRLKSRCL